MSRSPRNYLKMKSFFRLFFLLAGTVLPLCADVVPEGDEIVVKRVRGEWILSPESDESPKEAFFKAQNEARRKAIAEVCGETVSSWETLMSHADEQRYSGVVVTNSVGVVHKMTELRRGWIFPRAGESEARDYPSVFFEAEIAVKKSSQTADPAFTALIEGGKSRYKHNEQDIFSVKVAQDAFLTVFWLNHDFQADIVFPASRWESNRILAGKKSPNFPLVFLVSSPRAKKETGTLFFVLTKKYYPFLKSDSKNPDLEANRERIEQWMAAIPLRERFIYAVPFVIER